MVLTNLAKNIKYNFIFTILLGVLNLLMSKVFINNLGSEFNGLIKLFTQIISYLNLAELGLGTASAYALYKPLENNDTEKLSIVFSTMKKIYNKIFLFILVVGVLFTPFLKYLIKDFQLRNIDYIFWVIYVLNTALTYLGARYSIYLTADNKLYIVKIIQGTVQTIGLVLKIFVIMYLKSFKLFLLISCFEVLVNLFIIKRLFYSKYIEINDESTELDKTIGKDLFYIFWHKLAGIIVFNTDYILISRYISLTIVTVYSNYIIVINIIQLMIEIITSTLTPVIGKFSAQESKENIFKLFKKFYSLYIYIGIICAGITYSTVNSFIKIWIGKGFEVEKVTLILIVINLFILIARKPVDLFASTSGYFSDIHIPVLESLINFIISIILVKKIGLNGVILGTVCSNILVIFMIKPLLFYKKIFNISPLYYLKSLSFYMLLISSIIFIKDLIDGVLNVNVYIQNFYEWTKYLILEFTIYLIISTIIFIIFDTSFRGIYKQIREKK